MPRPAKVYWHENANAWRSDAGAKSEKTGRRLPVYFREIPNTPNGKRKAQSLLEAYLRERDEREAQWRDEAANPRVWSGVVEPYLASVRRRVEAGEGSKLTARSHTERLLRFAQFVPEAGLHAGVETGERLACTLSDDDLVRLVDHLRGSGCGPRRIHGILTVVLACFNWASKAVPGRDPKRIIPSNPFEGFERPSLPHRIRALPTRDDVAAFLRAGRTEAETWKRIPGRRCSGCVRAGRRLDGRCRRSHSGRAVHDRLVLLLCRIQAHCGTRPDELCRATWREVKMPGESTGLTGWEPRAWQDPETGQWWGRLVVFGKTSRKKGDLRRIPVPPLLTRAIERVRAMSLSDVWIFPRVSRGGEMAGRWDSGALGARVRRWRKRAGLSPEFVLYALRHRVYTNAVHRHGLTADEAGLVGGTGAQTIRSTYLHADDGPIFVNARRMQDGKGS